MTPEREYQNILNMLHSFDLHTGMRGADGVIASPEKWVNSVHFPFYASAAEILLNLREKMNTRTTPAGILNACKRVVKVAEKATRDDMKGVFRRGDRFCVCNGYQLLRLTSDLSGLPAVETEFDSDDCVNHVMEKSCTPLNLPTVGELKAWIAHHGVKRSCSATSPYEIDCSGHWVNPFYLLDMLQALPGCTASVPNSWTDPVYFTAENGDGILCPVKPPVTGRKAGMKAA